MAFASLFSSLSPVTEEVRSPVQQVSTNRDYSDHGRGRKRKNSKSQAEQAAPGAKRPCHQKWTTRTSDGGPSLEDKTPKVNYFHTQSTHSQQSKDGLNAEATHKHSLITGPNNMFHKGQDNKKKNNHHFNKQHDQKKKTEWQNNHHQKKNRGKRRSRKGGQDWKNKKQATEVKRPRCMTQEFKDHNALEVNGRLICKHFLYGRCIKSEDCQLEHVQGYNDLVKEVCKFYIAGACYKGASCPFMHNSIPCKFFHKRGNCTQGEDCRFSHEPLNDLTNKLLDEALKRDLEFTELAKKAEQKSVEQPVDTNMPENMDNSEPPDILLQPLRPNFYQSVNTNEKNYSSLPQAEETPENMDDVKPSDTVQPPSNQLDPKEPVCYSVEAVLGPQLSRPFPSFTSPSGQRSAPLQPTKGTPTLSPSPYSAKGAVRSPHSDVPPTPPSTQTSSYTPKAVCKESTDTCLSIEMQNKNSWTSVCTRSEGNNPQVKMYRSLASLQTHTSQHSAADYTVASEDHKGLAQIKQESLKTDVEEDENAKENMHLSSEIKHPDNSQSAVQEAPATLKTVFPSSSSHTPSSKNPAHLRVDPSALTPDRRASFHSFCTSPGSGNFKGKPAVPSQSTTNKPSISSDLVSYLPAAKQPTESNLYLPKNTADSSGKTAEHDGPGVQSKKTQKTLLCNLFASPISDSFQPKEDYRTASSGRKMLIQSAKTEVEPVEAVGTNSLTENDSRLTVCKRQKVDPTNNLISVSVNEEFTCSTPCDISKTRSHAHLEANFDSLTSESEKKSTSFHNLFASPITDLFHPKGDSLTASSCPERLIHSRSPSKSAVETSDHLKTAVERVDAPVRSFASLFAAPLITASPPSVQSEPNSSKTSSSSQSSVQPFEAASHVMDSKHQVKTNVKETPRISSNLKKNEGSLTECINQNINPPRCFSSASVNERSTCPTPHGQTRSLSDRPSPETSPCKVDGPKGSVLRTLFLHLSPFQDEEQQYTEQMSVPPALRTFHMTERKQTKPALGSSRGKKMKLEKTEDTDQQPSSGASDFHVGSPGVDPQQSRRD